MVDNAFGKEIPPIDDLLKNTRVHEYIRQTLADVLQHISIRDYTIVDDILTCAQEYSLEIYEKKVHAMLERSGTTERISASLTNRAQVIYEQIKRYVIADQILDYGCGDGRIGMLLAQDGKTVVLKDIYEHPNIEAAQKLGLEFFLIEQGQPLPDASQSYDITLLLTVLHHSNHPLQTLKEAQRVTKKGGYVIIIESVYGITDETQFGQLTHEEQRLANIFFDHFYNRVLHYSDDKTKKVNVPFNFNLPQRWKEIIEEQGMKEQECVMLGIDQQTVPEYHTLHIVMV